MPFVRSAKIAAHPIRAYAANVRRAAWGRGTRGMGDTLQDPETGITYDLDTGLPVDISTIPIDTGVTTPISLPSTSTPSSGGGLTAQQIANLFSQAASGAVNIFRATQSPSLVPGTQAVYNPGTGQFYNPVTGQVVQPAGPSTLGIPGIGSINPTTLLIGAGVLVGGLFLVSAFGRH